MRAIKAIEISKQVQMHKQNKYIAKHEKYAKKLTNTKVKRAAKKGYTGTVIKISGKYNRSLVADKIREYGFEVMRDKENLKIKW